jgi:O-antigen ligase
MLTLAARRLTALTPATAVALLLLVASEAALGIVIGRPQFLLASVFGIAGLALVGVALARPEWSALLLLFAAFSRLTDAYELHGWMLGLQALVLAAMFRRRWLVRREALVFDRTFAWLVAYTVAIALSALNAASPAATGVQLLNYLRDLLIVVLLVNLLTTAGALRAATWTLILAGVLLAGLALLGMAGADLGRVDAVTTGYLAGDLTGVRLAGAIGNANDLADVLVIVVPLALYRVWDEHRRMVRIVALAALVILTTTILLTFSRGGGLALLTVLSLASFRWRARYARLAVLGAVVLGAALFAPSAYWDRLGASADFLAGNTQSALARGDPSLQERSHLWEVGVLMFWDHPLIGVGKGNYLDVYPSYAWRVDASLPTTPLVAHSTPIQVLADTGMLGFASLIGALAVAVAGLRTARRQLAEAGIPHGPALAEAIELAIYGHLIASLFISDNYPRYLWILIVLAATARQVSLRCSPSRIPA